MKRLLVEIGVLLLLSIAFVIYATNVKSIVHQEFQTWVIYDDGD